MQVPRYIWLALGWLAFLCATLLLVWGLWDWLASGGLIVVFFLALLAWAWFGFDRWRANR